MLKIIQRHPQKLAALSNNIIKLFNSTIENNKFLNFNHIVVTREIHLKYRNIEILTNKWSNNECLKCRYDMCRDVYNNNNKNAFQ